MDSVGPVGMGNHVQYAGWLQDEFQHGPGPARGGSAARRSSVGGPLTRLFGSRRKRKEDERKHSSRGEHCAVPQPQQIVEFDELKETTEEGDLHRTKTQQMFEDKKLLREERRSLKESGDFLGVQGANPRTGYWDVSDATTSSDPSQVSDETKKKLGQQVRELNKLEKAYEEAQERHQTELTRVKTLREKRKKEKSEQKKIELKLRARRHGKWKLAENGWSSVAEPDLSPIEQSLAGSPVIGKFLSYSF